MSATPDTVELHAVSCCAGCGCSLADTPADDYDRRQVFDIPPVSVDVTEHRAEVKTCDRCGATTKAAFPETVRQHVQYGERIQAIALYLKNYALMPYERGGEFFSDLFGVSISPGTLVRMNRDGADRLGAVTERIKAALKTADVLHADETGTQVGKHLHWLHVASTTTLTRYLVHQKRGKDATDEMGILPGFQGTAVHDGWKSYFKYVCHHGLCNAHHLRELTCVYEEYGQSWGKQMIDLLLEIKERRDKSTGKRFSRKTIVSYEDQYREILKVGMEANPLSPEAPGKKKHGRKKKSKPRNLLERLQAHEQATLAFMYDFSVPFDNNQAERDVRMMKVQQKISGTFRSFAGAQAFCTIRGYISTARKQGLNVMSALQDIFSGSMLLPDI